MYTQYFYYSDKKEKWLPCKNEDVCLEKDRLGYDVRKVVYDRKPAKLTKAIKKRIKKNKATRRSKVRDRRRR